MKKILFLFFSVFNLTGLYAQDTVSDHYQTKQFDVAIFPKEYKAQFDFDEQVTRFTPTKKEVDTAECVLRELFRRSKKINDSLYHKNYGHPLKWYKRQYFGYIDDKGNRCLYIICVHVFKGDGDFEWLINECGIIFDSDLVQIITRFDLKTHKISGTEFPLPLNETY